MLRHLKNTLGEERFQRLVAARVGIGGLGGLGSNVAAHLVRSGVRRFVLADFDLVEGSNLNRQFYFADQVGLFKCEALTANLLRIQPELDIIHHRTRVSPENVNILFRSCDIWVEAFDAPEMKRAFVEAGLLAKKPVVSASGMAGWGHADAIQTHEWNSGLVVVGDLTSPPELHRPVLSPRVGVAAAKEADVVLNWILGEE